MLYGPIYKKHVNAKPTSNLDCINICLRVFR